jgi:hypothetical protein
MIDSKESLLTQVDGLRDLSRRKPVRPILVGAFKHLGLEE